MRTVSHVTALAVAALAALAFAAPARADVINGTFTDDFGNASLAGWHVNLDSNDVQAFSELNFPGQVGKSDATNTNMAVFGPFNTYQGVLSQTLRTIIGQSYLLSFQYGAGGPGSEAQSLEVTAGDLDQVVNSNAPSTDYNTIFSNYTFSFTATDTSTLLTFADTTPNNDPNDNVADGLLQNVSVAVPEPATLAVLGLGILSLCAIRRRHQI